MKEKDLLGKVVVSMADGAKAGTVKDLIFQELRLVALVIRGDQGEGLLRFENVGNTGADAITIESSTWVDWNGGKAVVANSQTLHQLRKLNVVAENGETIGRLHDLTLDLRGCVEELDIRTEGVFGIGSHQTLVPASQVRALGPTFITLGL